MDGYHVPHPGVLVSELASHARRVITIDWLVSICLLILFLDDGRFDGARDLINLIMWRAGFNQLNYVARRIWLIWASDTPHSR